VVRLIGSALASAPNLSLTRKHVLKGLTLVPRKKSTTAPATAEPTEQGIYWLPNEAAWGGFINVRLDDEQKQAFLAWLADNHQTVHVLLDDVLGQGMKVGFGYDRENRCYIVTFTGALVGGSNERYCATSRAGTLTECLGLAAWKHFYLCDGDYGNFKPRTSSMMSWG